MFQNETSLFQEQNTKHNTNVFKVFLLGEFPIAIRTINHPSSRNIL